MYFEQFYLTCLAHASYMIGSEGEAAVVDPQRDVDIYLKAADEQNLKIRHIFETHLHADFVSGHKELAARTGARIYIGAQARAGFQHVPLTDGFEVRMGAVRIRALETPGHTPESVCLVVTDENKSPESKSSEGKSAQPCAVLTGDTLFIGDVGRPDLSRTHTPQQLAGLLYDSLHQKLLALPDAVMVYPAHGAGSLCGRAMRAERSSTIGAERLTNYALQIASREEFIAQLTTNLPARPDYFLEDAEINRSGAAALTDLPPLPALSAAEVQALLQQNSQCQRPGRSSERRVCGRTRAGVDQHCALGTIRIVGRRDSRYPLTAGSDRRHGGADRGSSAASGSCRHRRFAWLSNWWLGGLAKGWLARTEDGADFPSGAEPETARRKLARDRSPRRAPRSRMASWAYSASAMSGARCLSARTAQNRSRASGCRSLQERISQHDWLQSARARGLSQCDQCGGRLRRVACRRTSRGCGTTRQGIVHAVISRASYRTRPFPTRQPARRSAYAW